jgi:hypothetical protein
MSILPGMGLSDTELFGGGGDGVAGSVEAETKMAKVAVVAAIRADEANPVKEELSESFSSRSMDRQATAAGAVVRLRIEECEIHGSGLSRDEGKYFSAKFSICRADI